MRGSSLPRRTSAGRSSGQFRTTRAALRYARMRKGLAAWISRRSASSSKRSATSELFTKPCSARARLDPGIHLASAQGMADVGKVYPPETHLLRKELEVQGDLL